MNNATVVSLSSGILLFDLHSSAESVVTSSSSSSSSYTSSDFMDPYQRCALLFALYQTSLESSDSGIGTLNLGVESLCFFPNQEADALIVLSVRSDFDEELKRRIASGISSQFAAQGINSQSSPRASSIKQLKLEIKVFLHSILLEKADKLSSLLLPNRTDADRNLCIYYGKGNGSAQDDDNCKDKDKGRDKDIDKDKIEEVSGVTPTPKTGTDAASSTNIITPNNNRRGRFFTIASPKNNEINVNDDSRFTTPVAPTKASWVNTIRSILGLRSRYNVPNCSTQGPKADNKCRNHDNFSTHVHHFIFSPNESSHFDQEKWKVNNDKINPNIIVNELVPSSFSSETLGSDRIYLEDEVTVSLLSNFRGCHYLWMYTRHRDDQGNVTMGSKKADLRSTYASELLGNMDSIEQFNKSRSTMSTQEICTNMEICSDLVHCLSFQFDEKVG